MAWKIELKEKPLQYTLVIRKRAAVGDLPKIIGECYMSIGKYLGEAGESPTGAPFVAYHNMDMENLDLELGFPVGKPLPGKDDIVAGEISAGSFLTSLYKGPYSKMEDLYNEMTKWMVDNGYEMAGAAYEYYLNSPEDVKDESEYLTMVEFPVRKI
jgi:effector-binding domain-containing protein